MDGVPKLVGDSFGQVAQGEDDAVVAVPGYEVSRRVNNSRNKDAAVIEAVK